MEFIRPDEIINIKILNYDGKYNENYINIKKGALIINDHKIESKTGTKTIILHKETIDNLKNGLDEYLISNKEGKPYLTSSSFSKAFKKKFNNIPVYTLRKAITSQALRRGNILEIKKLQHIQGHELKTQLSNYNVYSN
jgi:integrase